ncbi:putative transposase, Ptta/En/Spm, plant [Senna tora]|uniref:Putative transposase, Ptta/En/Spm, plant n=1 Tax=Senna tora TaxID=362788 RepID=A0A834SU14_9FABA|nr:putative transposase, Ptta/En/Spm, plant [Senna tora]
MIRQLSYGPSKSIMVTQGRGTRGRRRGDVPEGSQGGELPGASTGYILDSVESTVPYAGVDRRKVITVEKNGTQFGPAFVTQSIMSSVFGRMPFVAERWRDYSIEENEELFKEFMDKYQFQSNNDRKMARDVWEKTCMGIRAEVWDGLVDIWLTPEWQKKSEAAKRSRATAPDAMLHTRGSISFGAHKKKMEAEQNQKISWRDENLDIALLDKYGEEPSSYHEVDANLWLDVALHSKNGRIHGLGQGLQLSSGSLNLTSSACSTTSTTTPIIPQSQIDEAVSRAMTTMWSTQMAPMLQSFMSQVNQAPTRSSQGEEHQSNPANDDNNDADADADLGV